MAASSQPLKTIVVLNDHGYINGGQAKVAIDSAKGLKSRGYDVIFFCGAGPADPELQSLGIKVVCLGQNDLLSEASTLVAVGRGLWNRQSAALLAEILAGLDPHTSMIHCHGFAKALSPSIGPVIVGSPIPHVYSVHEFFLACPNGGFYDFQKQEICTRKALGVSCLTTNCNSRRAVHKIWRVGRQAIVWSIGQMPRNLKNIICISETQRRVLAPYLSPDTSVFHTPNPITIEKRPRTQIEKNDVYLFVGRLNPEKGGAIFAQAARNAGVRAVFVGDGPQADLIRRINPAAEIVGWVSPGEVETWLDRSRCLVFPSVWYETFGLVAYEAQARGIPVICGDWNAAAEGITDGRTGIIYKSPAVEALETAIRRLDNGEDAIDGQDIFDRYWSAPIDMDAHLDRLAEVYAAIRA